MSKKTPNGQDSLYLSKTDQREIEPISETNSDKIDDNSVQKLAPNTPKEAPQFPIQTETPLLENVKQIPKPSLQKKTQTFEQFETLLTRHLEKRLIEMQEKFESYFEKTSKRVANIECCQNQNTKTLQRNIANLKNELLSKNEIITTSINKQTDLLEKSKSHATIQKSPYTQRTQTSLRRLQDVSKRSRRLATKQDVVTTSGKRRRIYDALKTSDLRRLEDVQFRTS